MADIMIARTGAVVVVDGVEVEVHAGVSTADSDSRIVHVYPDLWAKFPLPDEDTSAEPSPKEVRAWAREAGIEVPDRGKLPDELVERYKAERG
jgi:hypothetical protein